MSPLICVDANFALKLVLYDPDSEHAVVLWTLGRSIP